VTLTIDRLLAAPPWPTTSFVAGVAAPNKAAARAHHTQPLGCDNCRPRSTARGSRRRHRHLRRQRPDPFQRRTLAGSAPARTLDLVVELTVMAEGADVAVVRRLFGAYRRAVEDFASAAEVCA
jgi:hypothetical protein